MRALTALVALVALLLVSVQAFLQEDHEIFRIRDELAAAEGPDVTFYNLVGVTPSATREEIIKVRRKRSARLHPDKAIPSLLAKRNAGKVQKDKESGKGSKNPGVKVTKGPTKKERDQVTREVNERYARFVNVAKILEGPARERYDHFLRNGFPIWRGTGYYYSRYRPGFGTVLLGLLVVFGGGAHYGALHLGYKRQRAFVERYVSHARRTAWGNDSGIPGIPMTTETTFPNTDPSMPPPDQIDGPMALNRRQKRQQEKESKKKDVSKAAKTAKSSGISSPVDVNEIDGPRGAKKKVVAENGKVLIVDSTGNVFLEETTEDGETQQFLLDPDEIQKPAITDTILFRFPIWIYNQGVGRVLQNKEAIEEPLLDGQELVVNGTEENGEALLESATTTNRVNETKKRKNKAR